MHSQVVIYHVTASKCTISKINLHSGSSSSSANIQLTDVLAQVMQMCKESTDSGMFDLWKLHLSLCHSCQPPENFDRDNCTYNMTLHYYNYVHAIIIVHTKLMMMTMMMMMKMTMMNMMMSMTGSSQWLSCIV